MIIVSMLFAGSALAAPTWLEPKNLSEPGFSAFRPTVGIDANGEVVSGWYGAEPGTGELAQVSARPRGGTWSQVQTLRRDGAISPDLAVSASGTAVMVWEFDSEEGSPDGSFIEAAVRTGGVWSAAPLPKDTPLQVSYFPRVAVDAAGDALAVWQQCYLPDNLKCFEGKGEYGARAAVRPAGGSWSQPMIVSKPSENAMKLSPAIDAAGDLALAWEDMAGEEARVALRRAGGGWSIHALAPSPSGSPRVAFAADGTATAAWDEQDTGFWVSGATAAPGSTGWSKSQRLSSAGFEAFQPDLAVAPNGDAVAVWETLSGGQPIQAAVRSGGAWQAAQSISAEGVAAQLPRVAINGAGAAVAVWQATGGSGSVVQANTRPGGGTWAGAKTISAPAAGATEPAVAIDAEGNGVAVWRAGAGGEFAQAVGLDAAGPRLDALSIPATGVAGQALGFSAAPSDAWSGVAVTSWSFGDGSGATGSSVAHAFSQPGTYQVTVTTADGLGSASTVTGTVVVTAATAGPGSNDPTPPAEPEPPRSKQPRKHTGKGIASLVGPVSVKKGKAVLALRCSARGPCAGVAKLVYQRTFVVGKAAFQLAAGGTRTLRLALGPAALEKLADSPGQRLAARLEGRGVKARDTALVL